MNANGWHHGEPLKTALEIWVAAHGPVVYQQWQSAWHGFVRDHGARDEEAPEEDDETRTAHADRMKKTYADVQEKLFGPDHRTRAVMSNRNITPEEPGFVAPIPSSALVPVTHGQRAVSGEPEGTTAAEPTSTEYHLSLIHI